MDCRLRGTSFRKVGEVGMTDIEKVIPGIKACWSEHFYHRCFDCPYKTERDNKKCIERLGADTLELLKEQEAVEPKHNPLSPTDWFCGKCGMCISRFHDYCPSCGQAVKWE